MEEQAFYNTIEKPAMAEFKDKGSRFIAYLYPLEKPEDFKSRLAGLKKEHPKASHHCFAYRLGTDGNNFRLSDDGEPSGTAGKPIMGQIDSKQLTNVLVFVVRYFGGTLLGVPGLINAYKTAAALVLQLSPVIQKQVEADYLVQFDYTQMNEIMMIMKQNQCTVKDQQMQLFCQVRCGIPVTRLEDALYRLGQLQNVEVVKA